MDSDKGQVVAWFDDKGYGFVRPDKLGADLFLHVKELLPHLRRPRVGDRVAYTIVGSETDKPRAARVAISGFAWSSSATACAGLFALSLVYAAFACSGQIPFHPAAAAYEESQLSNRARTHHHRARRALAREPSRLRPAVQALVFVRV